MRLSNDYDVNAGKYLDRRLMYDANVLKSVQVTKVQIFSSMDRVII